MRKEKGLSKLDLTVSDTDSHHTFGCFIYLNVTCLYALAIWKVLMIIFQVYYF